ncbi:MAG TPA: TAXI family TRAP transporter solute-binding subunit [Stellaceae bacterium]|nr:TAXI family TRAP transporter solute-binding subunit [Stellaceae bacterium]
MTTKRSTVFRTFFSAAALLLLSGGLALAQSNTLVQRTNRGVVELLTSGDAASITMAQDLASVIDDGATRRLLPVVGHGAVEGLVDLKALHGIDMTIAQTDVLDYARQHKMPPDIGTVTYIAKLHNEELHLLARSDIASVAELAGKKVDFAGGARITGPAVLSILGVKVEAVFDNHAQALKKLRSGEVAALAYVAAKPTPVFDPLGAGDKLHFLSIPMNAALAKAYVPARLTAADYPRLIGADAPVDTVAVGTALVVANLQPDSERYRNVANFVDAFFTQFPRLQEAPHHPKWAEVNLAAELPGWKRFPPAEAWLKRNAVASAAPMDKAQLREIFAKFLDQRSTLAGGRTLSAEEKDQLFNQFERWQQSSDAR